MTTEVIIILSVSVLIVAVLSTVVIVLVRRQAGKTNEIAEALGREFGGKPVNTGFGGGFSGSGEYEGTKFTYAHWPGSKNNPAYFKVGVVCDSDYSFGLTKEGSAEKFFKNIGLTVEPQSGDPSFDKDFFINSDEPRFASELFIQPEKREAAREVFNIGFTELSLSNHELYAQASPNNKLMTPEAVKRTVSALAELNREMPAMPQTVATRSGEVKHARIVAYATPIVLGVTGLGLSLAGYFSFKPLDPWDIVYDSLRYSGAAFAAFALLAWNMLKGTSSAHKHLIISLLIGLEAFGATAWGAMVFANGALDKGTPMVSEVMVIDKRILKSDDSTTYRLEMQSWRPGRAAESLDVKRSFYNSVKPGKTRLEVVTKPGHLGYEWLDSYSIVKK